MNIREVYDADTDKDLTRAWQRYSAKPITGTHEVTTTETIQLSTKLQNYLTRFNTLMCEIVDANWKLVGEALTFEAVQETLMVSDTVTPEFLVKITQLENLYNKLKSLFDGHSTTWPYGLTEYVKSNTQTVNDYGQSIAEQCGIETYGQFLDAIK